MSETLPAPSSPPRLSIRSLREQFDLTQADIADHLHVDERTVRRWEHGKSSPSPMARAHIRRLRYRLTQERERGGQGTSTSTSNGSGSSTASTPAPSTAAAATLPRRRLPSL